MFDVTKQMTSLGGPGGLGEVHGGGSWLERSDVAGAFSACQVSEKDHLKKRRMEGW